MAQGYAEFGELKHNILPFSEASGKAKYSENLQVEEKRGERTITTVTIN